MLKVCLSLFLCWVWRELIGIATATLALQQALATISAVNVQASNSIKVARMDAMTATTFALVVIFSILGSSLLTGLAYFFISRLIRRRKAGKRRQTQDDFVYDAGDRRRSRRSADFRGRKGQSVDYVREKKSIEFPGRTIVKAEVSNPFSDPVVEDSAFKSFSFAGNVEEKRDISPQRTLERKSTLPYDPNDSSKPPRFRSWLTESFRTVSMFGNGDLRNSREERELKVKKEKEEGDNIRKAAIKKVREGEERRELERKRRESEDRRLRARQENEEVERKVSLRRQQTGFGSEMDDSRSRSDMNDEEVDWNRRRVSDEEAAWNRRRANDEESHIGSAR